MPNDGQSAIFPSQSWFICLKHSSPVSKSFPVSARPAVTSEMRVTDPSSARCESSDAFCGVTIGDGMHDVFQCADCAQYLQSSPQLPVFAFIIEQMLLFTEQHDLRIRSAASNSSCEDSTWYSASVSSVVAGYLSLRIFCSIALINSFIGITPV